MVKKQPGIVEVVTLEHGVALVGETFDAVRKARRQLKVSWRGGESGAAVNTDKDLETYLGDGRDPKRVGTEWKSKGDTAKALSQARQM